jgi:hypothetical protein
MSDTIDKAPAAATLSLTSTSPEFFKVRDEKFVPATVTVPGSSNLELVLLDVTAVGTVKAAVPGMLTLTLFGMSKAISGENLDDLLPLASSVPEPIGGDNDIPETMWMIQGHDLMIWAGSGKLQGTFKSNVASNPQPSVDLEQHPGNITEVDPLYIFTVAAQFTPDADPGDGSELASLTLHSLTVSG